MSIGIPVPSSEPQEETFHYTFFNETWLPIVVGSLVDLYNINGWNDPPDDIIPQIDTLIAMIEDSLVIPEQVFPERQLLFHQNNEPLVGNAIVFSAIASTQYGGIWRQSTSAIDNEFLSKLFLRAGTYSITVVGQKNTICGKLHLFIDASEKATQDWYAASASMAAVTSTGIVITGSGQHLFGGRISDKNASSSAYDMRLCTFYFIRTGA
jgi:hypothetical protein